LKSALFNHYIVLQLKSFSRRRTPTFLLKGWKCPALSVFHEC
jgi:hypothetical protein